MIPAWLGHKYTSNSLHAQIRDAERQVLNRQQLVKIRSNELIGNMHRQMTAPASLILAGGMGFIAGELSKCPKRESAEPAVATGASNAIQLMLMAHTLYTTLPVAWLIKRVTQSISSSQQPN
ncbi:hypothetical protein QZJ86_09145 [Methylomonas montana]|uniref:hypothetical protein n=1 Tax=Methylomonas montana TaxID=3058963 RepID=UPI002657B67D|nr:hypothetical protein [Methylomonas montana]WKJ92287.1 hypothetical protein QZJ86_09145 [Methylomonas montana]